MGHIKNIKIILHIVWTQSAGEEAVEYIYCISAVRYDSPNNVMVRLH